MYKRQVVDNDDIDDKYVPVGRISVLVVEEYDEKIIYLGVTTNTDRDWTKLTNIDQVYETIRWKMNDIEVKVYYNNNNYNKLSTSKKEKCYKKVRLLHDDGG